MPTENKIAEPLKVERSTVTKLVITGAPRLNPITVFLEDFGRRDCPTESNSNYQSAQGKITINCWDNSWNAYWGGMGPRTVGEFVATCDWHYVLNCLDRGISSTRFTGDALAALARKCILERRRSRNSSGWEGGRMKRIYLRGPMTGPKDLNFPAFAAMTDNLRAPTATPSPTPPRSTLTAVPETAACAATSSH